jgi:acetyl esterase/lipase
LRLFLAGLVIVLVGGLSGVVVAQSLEPEQDVNWPQLTQGIVYGEAPRQVIHVFEPEPRADPRPAVVYFHGGGLIMGEPLQDARWAKRFAEQGYVTFMAGYRLFGRIDGSNPWPAQLDDAQRAVRWIRAHADEFGIDPDQICAVGVSSGGQLAGLLGTTEGSADPDPDLAGISSRVDCVVSISGPADLMVPDPDPVWTDMINRLYGGSVEEVPAVWQGASPAHNVDEATVPFLIVHGNRDRMVAIEMSRNLADALAAADTEYVYAEVPAGHMDILRVEAVNALIEAFLAYQLHPED